LDIRAIERTMDARRISRGEEGQGRHHRFRGAKGNGGKSTTGKSTTGKRPAPLADRYHDHILKSPREVRNALRYLFGNGRTHAAGGREVRVPQAIDTYTSAPWFEGFRERIPVVGIEAVVRPVADARTWLRTEGWLRHGRIGVHEVPSTA